MTSKILANLAFFVFSDAWETGQISSRVSLQSTDVKIPLSIPYLTAIVLWFSLSPQRSLCPSFASQTRGLQTSMSSWDAIDVKVPAMGESVTEGTIANVLKKAGGIYMAEKTQRVLR